MALVSSKDLLPLKPRADIEMRFSSWFDQYDESCVDTRDCQKSLVQVGESVGISIYNLVTIGASNMITGTNDTDQAPVQVSSEDLLNSVGHPWWSLIGVFRYNQAASWPNWPPYRNFFGLGDSYAAGIGASCGYVYTDDPSIYPGNCFKCQGAYSYQLSRKWKPFAAKEFKFYACTGATTGAVEDPSTEPTYKSQVEQMKKYGGFGGFGMSTLSIGGVSEDVLIPTVYSVFYLLLYSVTVLRRQC